MTTSTDSIAKPNDRAVKSVRILTWLAVALFLIACLVVPTGITVFWSVYFILFGPVIVVDLAAIIGFVVCRIIRRQISFAYLLMALAVAAAVWYVTWFQLRLRWWEIFGN
jgi:uncharacterized membrane protein